jgi:HK97 family phage major capsid protein
LRAVFPRIRMQAKPDGLKMRAPQSAVMHYDASIRSASKADNEIEILGEIMPPAYAEMFGGTSAKMVKDRLKAIGKAPVLVTINSPGGDAFEGIAIYNMLRDHGAKISVDVLGMAASAASIVAMAGDTIRMAEATKMMIHSSHGVVIGNRDDMIQFAELLDGIDADAAALYAARTGNTQDKVLAMMKKETWMNGEQAVESGFADSYDKKKKPKSAAHQPIFASVSPALLAASGDTARPTVRLSATLPGATGLQSNRQGKNMRTVAEQLTAFESKRAASAARMGAIMQASADAGATLDEAQTQEYDTLANEVKLIDDHLVRLRAFEAQVQAKATPITPAAGAEPEAAAAARGGASSGIVGIGPKLVPGQMMARYAKAMCMADGNPNVALSIVRANRSWMDTGPILEKVMMAAVATGDTTTAGWASEWVYAQNLANEFIEFLRPMTIVGRLPKLRRVPFNIRMGSMTGGTTGYWVGQAKPIPVSKATSSSLSLGITKAAGIVTMDDELIRSSSPAAEILIRDDLAKALVQLTDLSFIDPNQGGIVNIQPQSMLYQVTPINPSGTNAAAVSADIASLFATAIAANLDPSTGVFIMSPTVALKLSLMLTANGVAQYPNININGGTWQGLPVIVSQAAKIAGSPQFGEMIVLLLQEEILLADDGQVTVEVSKEAALELLDNPTNSGAGATTATSMISMFQTHSVAIKAVRYINWTKRRAQAAAFIQAANYA